MRTATTVRDAALAHLGGRRRTPRPASDWSSPTPRSLRARSRCCSRGRTSERRSPTPTARRCRPRPTEDGLLVHDPERAVPGLGWLNLSLAPGDAALRRRPAPPPSARKRSADGALLENELLRVEIGADGTLHRVVDKAAGDREVLAGRGNQLWAYVDKPRTYDAWDIEENYESEGEEIGGVEAIEVVETGPLRGAVRVRRAWRDSRIEQTYRLLAGSRRLDIATRIDWHERQIYLQARFPLAVHSHEATYETMYGVVRRPTHRNTSWDAARFEVSGHRFADLSEPGYGVALLNDAKYGHSAHGNVLTLSLLRGPLYPDPGADEGRARLHLQPLPASRRLDRGRMSSTKRSRSTRR